MRISDWSSDVCSSDLLHYWPTPNGHKVTLLLEALADAGAPLAYRIVPVDIGKGAQFEPAFLAISPNNQMPALVDTRPPRAVAPWRCSNPGRSCSTWPRRQIGRAAGRARV